MSRGKIIGIPPKTHLYTIVRHDHSWRIWTGIDDMQRPYERWTGVYILCRDDGTALRIRANRDGSEDILRIM
jgi:hypothetical protein